MILKGSKPEIKLTLTAVMPDMTDTFVGVFERGTKADYQAAREQAEKGELKDADFLNRWLIRVEDLEDAETGEKGTYKAKDIIPVMIEHLPYTIALVGGVWAAIGNTGEQQAQKAKN
jgi:hypothetical protein